MDKGKVKLFEKRWLGEGVESLILSCPLRPVGHFFKMRYGCRNNANFVVSCIFEFIEYCVLCNHILERGKLPSVDPENWITLCKINKIKVDKIDGYIKFNL